MSSSKTAEELNAGPAFDPDRDYRVVAMAQSKRIAELEEVVRSMLAITPCYHRRSMPSDCYQVLVPGTTVNHWRRLLGMDQ